jgi:hypothetical protein
MRSVADSVPVASAVMPSANTQGAKILAENGGGAGRR